MSIGTREELLDWLGPKPRPWSRMIATRAALRALPLLAGAKDEGRRRLTLAAFRTVTIAWAACNVPEDYRIEKAAAAAARAINSQIDACDLNVAENYAAEAVRHAAKAVGPAIFPIDAVAAADASAHAYIIDGYPDYAAQPWADDMDRAHAEAGPARTRAGLWGEIANDCDWLDGWTDRAEAPARLSRQPLWLGGPYDDGRRLGRILLSQADYWEVWTDWHERRIGGHDAGFEIPGDVDRAEDKAILTRLAEAGDEDFWDKGPEHVSVALSRWIGEARARAAADRRQAAEGREALARALEQQASPEARIVDGRFDAGPNQRFDAPAYSGNLAELPSILLANAGVLRDSLPANASALIGRCLDAYRDELRVRGNRPILAILKAMTGAVRAEVFLPPVPDLEDQPGQWTFRDAREWGAGAADLFRSFFENHLDLITHFPLDPEREALFEATPIDEIAASGTALTEPVDAVAALILDLADQGFATENIVRIIEAMQIYTRDVAQLPPMEESADIVSPKRRHILSTAGFYLSAYSVLGSTASIAPLVPALLESLRSAAAAMLSFIR